MASSTTPRGSHNRTTRRASSPSSTQSLPWRMSGLLPTGRRCSGSEIQRHWDYWTPSSHLDATLPWEAFFFFFLIPILFKCYIECEMKKKITWCSCVVIYQRQISRSNQSMINWRLVLLHFYFLYIGSTQEMQQPKGLQSLAQERSAIHEDVPSLSRDLPVDRQDGHSQQSHWQRGRQPWMKTLSSCKMRLSNHISSYLAKERFIHFASFQRAIHNTREIINKRMFIRHQKIIILLQIFYFQSLLCHLSSFSISAS